MKVVRPRALELPSTSLSFFRFSDRRLVLGGHLRDPGGRRSRSGPGEDAESGQRRRQIRPRRGKLRLQHARGTRVHRRRPRGAEGGRPRGGVLHGAADVLPPLHRYLFSTAAGVRQPDLRGIPRERRAGPAGARRPTESAAHRNPRR